MIMGASIKAMLVTLLLIIKMCLSVEINFWKKPLRVTFKNLRTFLCKALSLQFAVILLKILELMVLQNSYIILSALTRDFFLVAIFLFSFNLLY